MLRPNPKNHLLIDVFPRQSFEATPYGQGQRIGLSALDKDQSAIALLNPALEQVHRPTPDKSRHKHVLRLPKQGQRIGHLHDIAVPHHANASPMVIASTWSWVT